MESYYYRVIVILVIIIMRVTVIRVKATVRIVGKIEEIWNHLMIR